MNIEDIKVGEWYNVPFKVKEIKGNDIHLINGGIKAVCQPSELSVIGEASMPQHVRVDTSNDIDLRSPIGGPMHQSDDDMLTKQKDLFNLMNGRKKTGTTPKYDPCRKFRKGDIVRPCGCNGRAPWGSTASSVRTLITSWTLNVREDEARGLVRCKNDGGIIFDISPFFLELVTPVEELEPYFVEHREHSNNYKIRKGGQEFVIFWDTHPNAKEAAEAECARLNAEWRKEQE